MEGYLRERLGLGAGAGPRGPRLGRALRLLVVGGEGGGRGGGSRGQGGEQGGGGGGARKRLLVNYINQIRSAVTSRVICARRRVCDRGARLA